VFKEKWHHNKLVSAKTWSLVFWLNFLYFTG